MAPGAETEALAYALNRPGIVHCMEEQRDSAALVREAFRIINGLAPAESQIRCLMNDLRDAA